MSGVSAYAEKAMLDWVLGGATPTQPSARFLGLSLGTPSSTSGSEASYSGYARQTLVMAAATSPGGSALNNTALSFTNKAGSAITVVGWQLWDTNLSSNSGNMLAFGTLSVTTAIPSGSSLVFATNSVKISLA